MFDLINSDDQKEILTEPEIPENEIPEKPEIFSPLIIPENSIPELDENVKLNKDGTPRKKRGRKPKPENQEPEELTENVSDSHFGFAVEGALELIRHSIEKSKESNPKLKHIVTEKENWEPFQKALGNAVAIEFPKIIGKNSHWFAVGVASLGIIVPSLASYMSEQKVIKTGTI